MIITTLKHLSFRWGDGSFMRRSLLLALLFCTLSPRIWAYNFLYVHPTTGQPIRWNNTQTIKYWLDPGPLGSLTNEQAHTLLKEAMKIWESASPNANVPKFEFAGLLPEDVDGTNYQKYVSAGQCYSSDLSTCPSEAQKNLQTVIVFDDDNSILGTGLCQIGGCSANSGAKVFSGDSADPGNIVEGIAVFSSDIVSDSPSLGAGIYFTLGIMVHELGHLLGLAHTVVNQEIYIDSEWSTLKSDVPTMMSVLFPDQTGKGEKDQLTLSPDDVAGISFLYPSDTFVAETATIKGKVLKSNGSPMQFANVIARNVEDPLCEAYSFVSGRICPEGTRVSDLTNGICLAVGKSERVETSDFVLSGLPVGTYTLEIEEVADDSLAMTLAPGIEGAYIYGDAEFWNEGETVSESKLTSSTITLTAGETIENVDIVLDRSEVTTDRIKYIPLDTFTPGPGTRCQPTTTNYAALLGLSDPSETNSTATTPHAGCSLVR